MNARKYTALALVLGMITVAATQAADVDFVNPVKPALLTGHSDSQIAFAISRSTSIGGTGTVTDPAIPGLGALRLSNLTEVYQLRHAHLFFPDFQAGFTLPLVSRKKTNDPFSEKTTSVGDWTLFSAYRWMSDLGYRSPRPLIQMYGELALPTGSRVYELKDNARSEATGTGAFESALGVLVKKLWLDWDAFLVNEFGHGWRRTTRALDGIEVQSDSSPRAFSALGAGYRFKEWPLRIGSSVQFTYLGSRHAVSGRGQESKISAQRIYTVGLETQAQLRSDLVASLELMDDSFLGQFKNPALQRRVAFSLSYQWNR